MWKTLFEMCGFSQDEMNREKPRIEKALDKLGITEEDIKRGENRVREFWNIELEGVRKLLRIHLQGLINLMLAREEKSKVIYFEWPLPVQIADAALLVADDVYIGAPAGILDMAMGQIFGKHAFLVEAGEETGMPPGGAHCALFQTEVGAIETGTVPLPDLFVTSSNFCEPPAAAISLLHERYGVPCVICDGTTDSKWGLWPQVDERPMKYFGAQLDKCMQEISRVIGKEITEEAKHQAFKIRTTYALPGQKLFRLVASDPQPISQTDASLAYWLLNTPMPSMEESVDAVTTLLTEVQQRVEIGEGIVDKGAPRVHFTLNCAVDPTVVKMIEQKGVSVALQFWNILPMVCNYRIPVNTGGEKIASTFFKVGGFSSTSGMLTQYKEYIKEFDLDGVIICYSYSCRGYSIMPHMARDSIRKLGLPAMVLEGDYYDNRNYNAEQMRTRIETFLEVLKMNKASKVPG
jgi:hypothetical protein